MLSPPRTSIFLFNGTRDYPVPLIDVHCNKVILCTIYRVTNRFYALLSHYLFHVLAATMYVLCWSGTIKPQSLLVHLLDKLGANIQLILVGPPTLGQPYFVGIQGFELDCRPFSGSAELSSVVFGIAGCVLSAECSAPLLQLLLGALLSPPSTSQGLGGCK